MRQVVNCGLWRGSSHPLMALAALICLGVLAEPLPGRAETAATVFPAAEEPSTPSPFDALKDILFRIVVDNNSRNQKAGQPDRMSVEFQPDGVLVWRFAVHSCFQKIDRAKLADLDLRAARITDHKTGMYLDVPCKGGRLCVSQEYGATVWPVIAIDKECKDLKVTKQQERNFKPGAVPATYRAELQTVLKHVQLSQAQQPNRSEPAAAAQNFPLPRTNLTIQLRQVERGYKDFRQKIRIIKIEGDVVSLRNETTEMGQAMPALDQTMRFLVVEDYGRSGNSTNICKITSGAGELNNLSVGTQIAYELDCTLRNGNEVVYTAIQHVQRKILSTEKIAVAAGTFDTVLIEDASDIDLVLRGKPQPRKRMVNRYWFAPSIGYHVRKTNWDEPRTGSVANPMRMEAAQVQ